MNQRTKLSAVRFLSVSLVVGFLAWPNLAAAQQTVLQETRKQAEQGYPGAQYSLGLMYLRGEGVPKDEAEALKWFRKSAEQEYPEAQHAMKWFRKSAEQGDATGQYFLGVMYVEGDGVTKDLVLAYMWFNLAATQGLDVAIKDLSIMEKGMTRDQIAEAQRLSREWKPKK